MRLFQFDYFGACLGGTAIVIAKDADEALAALLAPSSTPPHWARETWEREVSAAIVTEIMIPRFAAVIYNDDGDC